MANDKNGVADTSADSDRTPELRSGEFPDNDDSEGGNSGFESDEDPQARLVLDAVDAVRATYCILHQPPGPRCEACIRGKTTRKRHERKHCNRKLYQFGLRQTCYHVLCDNWSMVPQIFLLLSTMLRTMLLHNQ